MNSWISILLLFTALQVHAGETKPILERSLDYPLKLNSLENGNFQYFYGLLRQDNEDRFINLFSEQSDTKTSEIVKTFMPLDINRQWNPKEEHHLAVAKLNYILPTNVKTLKADFLTTVNYLQQTLPKYAITKQADYLHVDGSFLTPEFQMKVSFIQPDSPLKNLVKEYDEEKVTKGKMLVSLMQQDHFGRVMFFRTAKMANTITIYQYLSETQTLVTQYILSNIINVPTRNMIRNGMIENIQSVVKGTRSVFSNKRFISATP